MPPVTLSSVTPIKARVRNGGLVLDAPTNLPEGTELDRVPVDSWDDLDDDDRRALNQAITISAQDVVAGDVTDATEVLRRLRARR